MAVEKNKHGLARPIPRGVALQVRRECGFGCVICGTALYEYDHFDPPYVDAERHDPAGIARLCDTHHGAAGRGQTSKKTVASARRDPFCKRNGESHWALDLTEPNLRVRFAGITFVNTPTIIKIGHEPILTIEPPEEAGAPPRLSANFYDRNGNSVARIVQNEWRGRSTAFDIDVKGKAWTIRSAVGDIDLLLRVDPPQGINIERLRLQYGRCTIESSPDGGLRVTTDRATLGSVPGLVERVERSPVGIVVDDQGAVTLGADKPLMMRVLGRELGPAGFKVEGGPVEFVDAAAEDPESKHAPGKKLLRISGNAKVQLNVPLSPRVPVVEPVAQSGRARKPGRNEACPCGSGKKFKKCCER